jgi:hypothetical protein
MRCPVCKGKFNESIKNRTRRTQAGEYVHVATEYDGVLKIQRLARGYLMHAECAKVYKVTERLLLSAGHIKKPDPWANVTSLKDQLNKMNLNGTFGKMAIDLSQLGDFTNISFLPPRSGKSMFNFQKLYEGDWDTARYQNVSVGYAHSHDDKPCPICEAQSKMKITQLKGRSADMIIMDDPYSEPATKHLRRAARNSTMKWFDETFASRITDTGKSMLTATQVATNSNWNAADYPNMLDDIKRASEMLRKQTGIIPSSFSFDIEADITVPSYYALRKLFSRFSSESPTYVKNPIILPCDKTSKMIENHLKIMIDRRKDGKD